MPACLTLRQVTYRLTRRGYRSKKITIITTLLDPVTYPAVDLAELYRKRWQIEVYFRDLKCTQGFDRLRAHSETGVRRELLGHVLLYNLVRAVMREAAARQQVAAERLSFIDALRHLRHAAEHQELPVLLGNPQRNRPYEPRRIKTRQYKFKSLSKPRAWYKTKTARRNAA